MITKICQLLSAVIKLDLGGKKIKFYASIEYLVDVKKIKNALDQIVVLVMF